MFIENNYTLLNTEFSRNCFLYSVLHIGGYNYLRDILCSTLVQKNRLMFLLKNGDNIRFFSLARFPNNTIYLVVYS